MVQEEGQKYYRNVLNSNTGRVWETNISKYFRIHWKERAKIGLRHSKVNLPAANNEELHRCAFTTNPNMPTSSNGGKHFFFFFYFMQHAHTNALHQSVHVEYGSRLKQAPTPRHLSSFIIHIAIYHTLTPAVHTNKSLQHYKHGKGVAVCVGDCI